MYSVVLLAAMSAGGGATPAWCHGCFGGCHGCHGCYGCYGYSGCYGFGGCYGGWYGYGCYGSCYGCGGGYGSCFGCYGGFGSCYGSCFGCYGYSGGCYGCYGGYGCAGFYGGATFVPDGGPVMAPATGGASVAPPAGERGKLLAASPQPARVIVDLPQDAKLFVDDQEMKTTSARRVFRTPDLEPGQTYYYILRVEVDRDGKALGQTKRIFVRAGEEVRTSLHDLEVVNTPEVGTKDKPVAAR